ncbi:Protein of unknown function (DUF1642) [Enterococcus faecium]|uniref:DUF1642 domain-containing protein n=1 Tax=Enterococcus faecium TaxID=1352 RepID=UPI001F2E673D|nr:DUF1642 domain-containing protein [Enterococcus faecium]CAH2252768.1 Protein of unknown function (DUF1642) [Enterococcus faecium]CAH2258897.1 Protein of unknown function (DUF1642) [Enterococcus faecium]
MLTIKKGQTYICTKSDKRWWTVGKEYPVFLDSYNEPAIRDDDGDDWHSSYLSISNNQFKLKEEQPKVTLDEPQKPVVPKFVAEWFEDNKDDLEFAIWELCVDSYDSAQQGMLDWIQQSENKPIETLVRMKDGYEVEKEPVWAIKNADGNYLTKCALWGKDGVNYSFECNPSHRLFFTDKATADAAALLVNGTVEEEKEK